MIFEWKNPLKTARNFVRSCAVWGGMFMAATGIIGTTEAIVEEHILDRGYKAGEAKEIFHKAKLGSSLTANEAKIFARSYQNHKQIGTGLTGAILGVSLVFLGAAERPDKKEKPVTAPTSKTAPKKPTV